ncbi:MraY family glycosyltransferase [Pseudomonas sp. 5P_3.1_Bac2]|uniref:MraY family glycosyltransferase n=1 Tax=Pseudomonas sp. 5P_3.1_Bac2 TaxID=2971617 RepID=UPI0021C9000A|nr:glycosyltransferase family 4 protein [Pseudomonas sp. 5P_3.1_Bac2]MCU1716538.1 glycosyltransferase family 4 protein [Pseudomonas sp. 5P_3.1_Bac2]
MSVWWYLPLLAGVSCVLTALLRRYAIARSLLDVPNLRSSHSVPTPRGGGVAIVLSFIAATTVLYLQGLVALDLAVAILGAGGLTALVGFLDDHGHIQARWRLLAHFVAALWGLYWLGGMPQLELLGVTVQLGWLGQLLAVLYLVWMLNLYNFMDGIDGIAAIEAITVCLSAALLSYLADISTVWLALLLAACVLGFLVWNFPPARIFMGDAGSGFLGVILALLSLQAATQSPDLLWAWLILLGVFIVDATYTLLRRLLRGDKVYQAHRSHAYQYASRLYQGHLPITLAVALINLLWLLPVALMVVCGGLDGLIGLILAYIPLVLMAIKYRAGQLEVCS